MLGERYPGWASSCAGPCDRALSALVSIRIAYLAALRGFGWLALVARSDRVEDAVGVAGDAVADRGGNRAGDKR